MWLHRLLLPRKKNRPWNRNWSNSCYRSHRRLVSRTVRWNRKDWSHRKEVPKSYRVLESHRLKPIMWARSSYVMILSWGSLKRMKMHLQIRRLISTIIAKLLSAIRPMKYWKAKLSICCNNVWILIISVHSVANSKVE